MAASAASMPLFPHVFSDELLLEIFSHIPPEDNLRSIQLVCKKFAKVADDQTIWRRHCCTSFQYWRREHLFHEKIQKKAALDYDWKRLWLLRKRINAQIEATFNIVLRTKVGRLRGIRHICCYGYDAKDFLLEQSRTADDVEDVLARRYYSMMILDSLHRGMAVEVWSNLHDDPQSSRGIDQAFGAFDMFVLHDQPQDLDYISKSFDDMADSFSKTQTNVDDMTTREKALAIIRWLRAQGFRGIANEIDYRNLRNCMIGHALSDPDHPSLPIVSGAIYCALATRLGIEAACCSAPSHVHVAVSSRQGEDLDGNPRDDPEPDMMYIDPYTSAQEIRLEELERRQAAFRANFGGQTPPIESFLDPAPVRQLVLRLAANLEGSYRLIKRLPQDDARAAELMRLRAGDPEQNPEVCLYAHLWAALMAVPPTTAGWDGGLDFFLNRFALQYSEDHWIVEKYLGPRYDAFVAAAAGNGAGGGEENGGHRQNRVGWENVREILKMLSNLDMRQPMLNRRYTQDIDERVRFKIGQVVRHVRYGYVGVVNGWAAAGMAALPTPHYVPPGDGREDEEDGEWHGTSFRMKGRTYYTVLRPSVDRLRIEQENLELVTDPEQIPEQLFFVAGKFFKRFDKASCTYVSNITEFYPDD